MNEQYKDNQKLKVSIGNTDKETSVSYQYFKTFEEIGVMIGAAMKEVFSDYIGMDFRFENGVIKPVMHFATGDQAMATNGLVRAYEPIQVETYQNQVALNLINYTNAMSTHKTHRITEAGKDVLSQFVYCNKVNDFKWDVNFNEENIPAYIGGRQMTTKRIAAGGFDFIKMLRFMKIGGIEDLDNEQRYNIVCNLVRTARTTVTPYPQILSITIYDMNEMNRVAKAYGIGVQPQLSMMESNIITPDMA